MSKPIVGLDLDDSLSDVTRTLLAHANYILDASVQYDDLEAARVDALFSIGREIWAMWAFAVDETPPAPYSVEVVARLHEKYDVLIVTATQAKYLPAKLLWLDRHFPFISQDQVVFAKRKQYVNLDVLVDDDERHLAAWLPDNAIILDRPWNRHIDGLRANDWLDVEQRLEARYAGWIY